MVKGWLRLLAIWLCAVSSLASCGGMSSSVTDCPSYLVVVDDGVSGFSSVGEWRIDAVCSQYCAADYPVCQLASPMSVKCQKGCG